MIILRGLEFLFSLTLVLVLLPFFLSIALAIKLTSKGPIFFLSPRIGLHGTRFYCFKFRTMSQKEDDILRKFFEKHPNRKNEWKNFHKLQEDPRVYPLGKFLRKTSLDELPQFFNVIMGTMSIIGPRPLLERDLAQIPSHLKNKFLSVKPGITGLWQVSGRNSLSFSQRVFLESQYIDQKNIKLDIKIFFKTFPAVLSKKGAF